MSSAWGSAIIPALVAVAVIMVPGLLATWPLRLSAHARIAVGGASGIAVVGLAGVIAGLVRIPFTAAPVLITAAVVGVALWTLLRKVAPRGRDEPPPRMPRASVVVAWGLAAVAIAFLAFSQVPDPSRISQTYDNVFHLAAIAHILETGDASSLTLRTLIETDKTWAFYPSGWHSIVALTAQLSGAGVPVAVNATWLAVAVAIWVPGSAWLAVVLLPQFDRVLVSCVATLLSATFAAMPYTLLTWGSLYPTFLATAVLPVAIAAPVAIRGLRRGESRRLPALGGSTAATAAALGLVAVCFAQPRVLASWALIIAPFVISSAVAAYRSALARGGVTARRARMLLVGFLAAALLMTAAVFSYAVFGLGLFERPLTDRLSGPQARGDQSIAQGLLQVLAQSWPTGVAVGPTLPAAVLAVAVLIGIVAAGRRRGFRWMAVAYASVAILFALAAGSDDVLTKLLTALWYKDRYRLSSVLPVLGVTLATFGILALAARVRGRLMRTLPLVLAAATASSAILGLAVGGLPRDVAFVFRLPSTAASTEVVSAAQIEFLRASASWIPPDQRVLGDPWDGSALSLVYGGREPVFPHVNGQWDAQRAILATRLDGIGDDPAVCAALDALRVRFVVYAPHEFGGGDPSGNKFAAIHAAVQAGLFTTVATDGDSSLLRIDQCGPLPAN
ncbi:DUF6541 family protein [Microbacterium sp. 10M-3C3]|uniref:DUF6541 family protein n=1 Tax=Microbacterium sp. 10M-3C3 TaxID=2483401 RepID=UPI000F6382CD|nr:DUF6541 family protein [Microbacterium sp. 10M-3C3]